MFNNQNTQVIVTLLNGDADSLAAISNAAINRLNQMNFSTSNDGTYPVVVLGFESIGALSHFAGNGIIAGIDIGDKFLFMLDGAIIPAENIVIYNNGVPTSNMFIAPRTPHSFNSLAVAYISLDEAQFYQERPRRAVTADELHGFINLAESRSQAFKSASRNAPIGRHHHHQRSTPVKTSISVIDFQNTEDGLKATIGGVEIKPVVTTDDKGKRNIYTYADDKIHPEQFNLIEAKLRPIEGVSLVSVTDGLLMLGVPFAETTPAVAEELAEAKIKEEPLLEIDLTSETLTINGKKIKGKTHDNNNLSYAITFEDESISKVSWGVYRELLANTPVLCTFQRIDNQLVVFVLYGCVSVSVAMDTPNKLRLKRVEPALVITNAACNINTSARNKGAYSLQMLAKAGLSRENVYTVNYNLTDGGIAFIFRNKELADKFMAAYIELGAVEMATANQ